MANFYRIGAAGLNWKNTGSWSGTSGGASNGVDEPSSSDAVLFDTNSPATVTVNAAASGASLSLNKASLVITLNGGSVTISGTTTITTNSATVNNTASETFSTSGLTSNASFSGSAKIILTGGTWSGSNTTSVSNNIDLQGNVTIGTAYYKTGTLKYVSGTINPNSTLGLVGSCTLDTNGVTWNSIQVRGSFTITLASNLSMSGTYSTTTSADVVINKTTSETWTCSGNFSPGTSSSLTGGTSEFIMTGGTITTTQYGIGMNFTFAGNVTIQSGITFNFNGNYTLKYTSGTVTTTNTTLQVATCTLDTNGVTWNTVLIANTAILTINSLLTASTLSITATTSVTFDGTYGFTVNTFSCADMGANTISFKESVTYTITTSLSCYESRVGSNVLFTSSHATTKAIITLVNPSSCNCLASFRRIDASAGRTINTFNGTVTDCINIRAFNDLSTVSSAA